MEDTPTIRNAVRAARRAVSPADRARFNQAICNRVSELASFDAAVKVAGFLAFDGEADPLELMIQAEQTGKQVYVPTIIAKRKPLKFMPWRKGCQMAKNRFGIYEPVVAESEWIEGRELDFVINPLVAFDEHCNRIGVGGGFYDRTFAFLNDHNSMVERDDEIVVDTEPSAIKYGVSESDRAPVGNGSTNPKTHLVGFAFELQRLDSIEANPWDVQLDYVATEAGLYSSWASQ